MELQLQCHSQTSPEIFQGNSPQWLADEPPHDLDPGHQDCHLDEAAATSVSEPQIAPRPTAASVGKRAQQYLKQQKWLLFLWHANKCTAPEGQCQSTPHCHTARELLGHIFKCNDHECQYPRCQPLRMLIKHNQQCQDSQCPVCGPIRQKLIMRRMQSVQGQAVPETTTVISRVAHAMASSVNLSRVSSEVLLNKPKSLPIGDTHMQQHRAKRIKTGLSEFKESQTVPFKLDCMGAEVSTSKGGAGCLEFVGSEKGCQVKPEVASQVKICSGVQQIQLSTQAESSTLAIIDVPDSFKNEMAHDAIASVPPSGHASGPKCSKTKVKGVSLTEFFTPEQIREHIASIKRWEGQRKAKAEKNKARQLKMNENCCQLCAFEKLMFEPLPIYCTPCGDQIKRNTSYWTKQSGEARHYVCARCYNTSTGMIHADGITYPKKTLERWKNEGIDEPWALCEKCKKWQHQVCALFNTRRNDHAQAEYTCPDCLIKEIEEGKRKPLPQSAVLGAKDLPRTLLSNYIEERLARSLKHERLERARAQGKSYNEVPGAESLVIRIVSSVDKKLEVKQRFLEIFQEEDYPLEFPYKSKVLLLFQKIEGVEVCLFGMYVQEFGAECRQPNQRRVYLSYLDSVKYFRPDVKTVSGEALRTFVYHEILIGYLEYCKKRGFTSCYIWSCPPLECEDYILYCHPEIQKTPRPDKLREWYLRMLRKAAKEDIVTEVTNMYDHFFLSTGEARAKVTATRLPYFDGDYLPGLAEEMIMLLEEGGVGGRQQKKGKTKRTATNRATKAAMQFMLASNASKDLQLMHKLGEKIRPMKEDCIMVHLQYACTHCSNFILSGRRWACRQCKSFRICDKCHALEQKRDEQDRHPINCQDAHQFFPEEVMDPLPDTNDHDDYVWSEFFDSRQAFLSLCQGNHYQYDTLRRAKHSSMMVLYHLHNPTAPAFVFTCNICQNDIETGQGWRCETCPDFDICKTCYSKDDSVKHPHELTPHPFGAECEAQTKEARKQRVIQLSKILDLLVHASHCAPVGIDCTYPKCCRAKVMFRHGLECKVRASGGCHICRRMWYLLQLHAQSCRESECQVPRCKDLRAHLRCLQQQQESRRRAAVNEMMRRHAVGGC